MSIKILVNDDPISDYDIDQRERFLAITTQQQPSPALKKEATDMLIDERLQLQEGRKVGVTPDEDDVTKILEDMAEKNNLTVDGLATALGQAGVNIKTLKDRIRAQLVWQEAVRRKFRRDVQIGDADVDKAMSDAGEARRRRPGGDRLAAPAGEVRNPRRRRSKDHRCKACGGRGSARPIWILRRARQGRNRRKREDASGPEAGLSGPARAAARDEREGRADDAPHHFPGGRRALRGLRQALVQGRRRGPRRTTQRKLMNQEMALRAERLLRDLRQEAFIEYR